MDQGQDAVVAEQLGLLQLLEQIVPIHVLLQFLGKELVCAQSNTVSLPVYIISNGMKGVWRTRELRIGFGSKR